MNLIHTFFFILSLIIWARIIFSFIGYNYGAFYDLVYNISEKILRPIRKRLPSGPVDWSPFVALIIFDILGKVLYPVILYAVNGKWSEIFVLLLAVFTSLLSSVITFFIIIVIVKIVNDHLNGQHHILTHFLNSLTAPFTRRINSTLSYGYQRFSIWIFLALLIILRIAASRILENIIYTI